MNQIEVVVFSNLLRFGCGGADTPAKALGAAMHTYNGHAKQNRKDEEENRKTCIAFWEHFRRSLDTLGEEPQADGAMDRSPKLHHCTIASHDQHNTRNDHHQN